jgi:glycosyltransferase involved in cell wall biosynthesis
VIQFQKKETEGDSFPIRYVYQKNGGKHQAVNRGVKEAVGDFLFIVDSDDYLLPDAMQYATRWCSEIRDLPRVAGVAGRRVSPDQKEILGYKKTGKSSLTKKDTYITAPNNQRKKYHLSGDQAEIYKTSILKRFPFREFPGENFLSEDSVWNVIAGAGYVLRWYPQPIYVCDYRDDGLSAKVRNEKLEWKNFEGFSYRLAVNWRYAPNPVRKIMRLVRFYKMQKEKGYTTAETRYRLAKFCHMMDQQS